MKEIERSTVAFGSSARVDLRGAGDAGMGAGGLGMWCLPPPVGKWGVCTLLNALSAENCCKSVLLRQ